MSTLVLDSEKSSRKGSRARTQLKKSLALPSDMIHATLYRWRDLFIEQAKHTSADDSNPAAPLDDASFPLSSTSTSLSSSRGDHKKKATEKKKMKRKKKKKKKKKKKPLGMKVISLNSTLLKKEMELDPHFPNVRRGVLVTEVSKPSLAADVDIRSGDVITLVNERQISRASQLEQMMRARAQWNNENEEASAWTAAPPRHSASSNPDCPSSENILRFGIVRKQTKGVKAATMHYVEIGPQ
mmetsp:Transcript_17457/g.28881  ORF Transcript_17457/g.28881 Transcript_17457/m.28881 type:complete len:241 (+) Transcript_17457:207-929(+)